MFPRFDHITQRIHEAIGFMKLAHEFSEYNLDWAQIELDAIKIARVEISETELMTKGRLLDIIEDVVCEAIESVMKDKFTVEVNDAIVELLDEGKLRMLVNEDGELVYEIHDDE